MGGLVGLVVCISSESCIGACLPSDLTCFPLFAPEMVKDPIGPDHPARLSSLPHLSPSSHRPFPTPFALHKTLPFSFSFSFFFATVRIISYLYSHTHRLLDLVSSSNDHIIMLLTRPVLLYPYSEHRLPSIQDISCIASITSDIS